MRTRNEKILLLILIAMLFATGNYFGYSWLSHQQSVMDLKYSLLKADKADAEVDLLKQDLWSTRADWIKQHQPALGEEGDAKAQVLESVLKGARDNKLEIVEQSLNDSQPGPAGTQINVTVKVKGPMEGLCHWIADLQQPQNFYAVSSFSLKADQDQKSMICTLQLARYFKSGS